jgi:hypothetical protein
MMEAPHVMNALIIQLQMVKWKTTVWLYSLVLLRDLILLVYHWILSYLISIHGLQLLMGVVDAMEFFPITIPAHLQCAEILLL